MTIISPNYGPVVVPTIAAASSPTTSGTAGSAAATDVVDIRTRMAGRFTAMPGDRFALGVLFASTTAGVAGYTLALRDGGRSGRLELGGADVSSRTSFTPDEFDRLHFVAGPLGSSDDLVVVAQTGRRLSDGSMINEVDSQAVQITAQVTGTRSINATAALRTDAAGGADAAFVDVARRASIHTGFGAERPTVATVGNLTAGDGDRFALSALFTAAAPSGSSIAGYRLALRDGGTNGRLELNGRDVSTRQSFTPDEFDRLHYLAGPNGSSDDLVVIAQTGKRLADGSLINEIDSQAVQITAASTGTRSINAASALRSTPSGADAVFVGVARQAGIHTGFGAARPGLVTLGNLTAKAGDRFAIGTLFSATAPPGGTIAGYTLALRDGGANGRLELGGVDVSARKSFTPDEFDRLHYVAGRDGSSDDLVVIAQTGKRLADGSMINEVDSQAVQITAQVTGTRSINATAALRTDAAGGADAAFIDVARRASIHTGFGAERPTLTSLGALGQAAADLARLAGAYRTSEAPGTTALNALSAFDGTVGQALRTGAVPLSADAARLMRALAAWNPGGYQTAGGAAQDRMTVIAQARTNLTA